MITTNSPTSVLFSQLGDSSVLVNIPTVLNRVQKNIHRIILVGSLSVTIKEGAAGYLYLQCPPDLETRPTGQGDHVQGSRDLHSTGSCD